MIQWKNKNFINLINQFTGNDQELLWERVGPKQFVIWLTVKIQHLIWMFPMLLENMDMLFLKNKNFSHNPVYLIDAKLNKHRVCT